MSKLYSTHLPLSLMSRIFLAAGSGAAAITNPARGDMVAAMGETTAFKPILLHIRKRMEADDVGKRLLEEQPHISEESIHRSRLLSLPDGTFGKEYARFLESLQTSPDNRPPVKYIDDESLLYVMQRYRETHDFTHIILQMKTHMLGEVTVKYFEAVQLGLPMAVLGSIFGGSRLFPKHRHQLLTRNLPWVLQQAEHARLFITFDWENHFERPIRDIQHMLNITPIE